MTKAIENKQEIIDSAKDRILNGETVPQIANSYGISDRTLHGWLAKLGNEYVELRQAWIDSMLGDAKESIDGSTDYIQVARAREQIKFAIWYAERRDSRYSPTQAQVNVQVNLIPKALLESADTLLDSITSNVLGTGRDKCLLGDTIPNDREDS